METFENILNNIDKQETIEDLEELKKEAYIFTKARMIEIDEYAFKKIRDADEYACKKRREADEYSNNKIEEADEYANRRTNEIIMREKNLFECEKKLFRKELMLKGMDILRSQKKEKEIKEMSKVLGKKRQDTEKEEKEVEEGEEENKLKK